MLDLLSSILDIAGSMLNKFVGVSLIVLGLVLLYLAVVAGGGFWAVVVGLFFIGYGIYWCL